MVAYLGFEVGQVKVMLHLLAVLGFVIGTKEEWIQLIKGWGWMLKLSYDDATFHIVQQCFVVLGLVGEPVIIDKNILCPLLTLGFVSYTNGRKTRIVWWDRNSTNGV
jgi:hypothetical protein